MGGCWEVGSGCAVRGMYVCMYVSTIEEAFFVLAEGVLTGRSPERRNCKIRLFGIPHDNG